MLSFKKTYLVSIAAALLLTACQWNWTTEPSISEQPVLMSPGATDDRPVRGVPDMTGLDVSVRGDAVEATLVEREGSDDEELVPVRPMVELRAVEVGTANVEVRLEGSLLGTFEVTVAHVDRIEVEPIVFAEVEGDFALLAGESHPFAVTAYDADDRRFGITPEVVSADPAVTAEVLSVWGGTWLSRHDSGPFSVEYTTDSGEKGAVDPSPVQAVAPEEIVALQVELDVADRSFVASGLTADGTVVLGLPAVYTVDGGVVDSVAGVYCPEEKPDQGTMNVTWNGFSATL